MSARKPARSRPATRRNHRSREAQPATVPARDLTEEYNELIANVDLLSVSLLRAECGLHPERMPADEAGLSLATPRPEYRWGFGADGASLHVGVRYRLEVTAEKAKGPILAVVAEYSITYTLANATRFSEATAQEFSSRNGIFNGWPFFRELAHSLVARMGMPPLILQFLKLPPRPLDTGKQEYR